MSRPIDEPAAATPFPPIDTADEKGRVFVGADLEPATLLTAYRSGLFPMARREDGIIWWSPDPRAVIEAEHAHVSHSVRRAGRAFEIRVDTAFDAVVAACAERAPGEFVWITDDVRAAYDALHDRGWAHSVEAWQTTDGEEHLVGGLYGIAIGGMFFGESMFHRRPNASKVAFAALIDLLTDGGADATDRLIDCQWLTPHLASLGAIEVPRREYLVRLGKALARPLPAAFAAKRGADE